MKVVIIVLGLLLIATIVLIFQQKEKIDVQREFLNLSLQRVKELEQENASLKRQVASLSKVKHPQSTDKDFQGH